MYVFVIMSTGVLSNLSCSKLWFLWGQVLFLAHTYTCENLWRICYMINAQMSLVGIIFLFDSEEEEEA